MTIAPINSNTNSNNTSYLRVGAVGVLGGIVAKYAIPVSKQEFDTFVSQSLKDTKDKLTKDDISSLAKASRSTFDFAVVAALALMAYTCLKNLYNKNKLAQN